MTWNGAREILEKDLLSVVMPVFNLGGKIYGNILDVKKCLDESGVDYEIVPVDDGSSDESASGIQRAASEFPSVVKPVLLRKNEGKGNALKAGLRMSKGGFVLLLDGDLDIKLSYLPEFFNVMKERKADIVIGSKRHPSSKVQYPWHRRLASKIYFSLVRLVAGLPITDSQTGMKLFKRSYLEDAFDRMLVKTYAFDLELLAIAYGRGARIAEAPVEICFGAKFGALKIRTIREMMHDTLAVFYRLRFLNYYAKVEVPPPLEKPPLVSVVIACPGNSWMLEECLSALSRQTYANFEAIVLPDEGLDGFDPSKLPYPCEIVPTGKVRPAQKRNTGIEKAKGDVVAFIDDDAYPDPSWLANAVKYFSEPSIGGVGGPGVTPPGDSFLARAGGRVYENIFVSGNYRYRYLCGRVRLDVDDYPSCNLFVRTDLLRKIGGYRTDFWPGEDTLLCDAVVLGEHKRIVYDPWVVVFHHRRKLFGPHLRQLGRYGFHRGYFVKRFPATSCKLSYFVPSLFVLGLLTGASVFLLPCKPLHWTYLGTVGAYAFLVAASSFTFNLPMWLLTAFGVFASHVCYGVKFIQGLAAKEAPCEYIGGDHAGGNNNLEQKKGDETK